MDGAEESPSCSTVTTVLELEHRQGPGTPFPTGVHLYAKYGCTHSLQDPLKKDLHLQMTSISI